MTQLFSPKILNKTQRRFTTMCRHANAYFYMVLVLAMVFKTQAEGYTISILVHKNFSLKMFNRM